MPANFTRRRDLFEDAGFADVDRLLPAITAEIAGLGLSSHSAAEWSSPTSEVRGGLAARAGRVDRDQLRLALLVPEWLAERSGDLATALWLAREEHGEALDVPGFLLAVFDALLRRGRERDALAFARFVLDLGFDWSRVYRDHTLAYEFLRDREPNPLVWQLLDWLGSRDHRLRVLELGCGRGNDAFGFLRSDRVDGYVGIDLAGEAMVAFGRRVAAESPRVTPSIVHGDFAELLAALPDEARAANLVYSYSSLHYFSSGELRRIFAAVNAHLRSLRPAPGFFAFAIKGAGSIWHGQGLPLYRPDVWVNWDGQSRWFPSKAALGRELDLAGFEVRFHELHDHWGYSEEGKRDIFHYVLCSPRAA
jgi:SAM-dependent methyltransferase